MSRRYKVKNLGGGSTALMHEGKEVAVIERIHHYPEFYNNWLGKKVPNTGKKSNIRYVVTNLPGASEDMFRSAKGAIQHAAFHHLNNERLAKAHPIKTVGLAIEHLGKHIHTTAADHRMTESDQEKLLEISKQHAALRKTYNTHFGDHINK